MPTSGPGLSSAGTPAPPKPSGLRLTIDSTWVPPNGYRPVRVKITPTAPITANRTLEIRLTPHGSSWGYGFGDSVQVSQEIDIPAGSNGVAFTMSVPQEQPWERLALDVFEEGVRIDELSSQDVFGSSEQAYAQSRNSSGGIATWPSVLVVGLPRWSGGNAPGDVNSLFAERLANLQTSSNVTVASGSPNTAPVPFSFLPDRWVNYSGVDIVVASVDGLQGLVREQPKQWDALRRTVAAGGTLVIFGVGGNYERLPEVAKTIDLPSLSRVASLDSASKSSGKPSDKAQQGPRNPSTLRSITSLRTGSAQQGASGAAQILDSSAGATATTYVRAARTWQGHRRNRPVC